MTAVLQRPEAISLAFDDLADRLRAIAGDRNFVFVVNPGNWGDSLIRAGAEAFLQHYGLRYTAVSLRRLRLAKVSMPKLRELTDCDDPVMLFNGNGAMNTIYGRMPMIAGITEKFSTNIFLPATFATPPGEFGFAPNCHFFVRDRGHSHICVPDAPFCHDMAFFLEPTVPPPGKGTGFMFRSDSEAPADQTIPRGNVDLSIQGRVDTPIGKFMDSIAKFETIHTNRLHVGIGAALLGRRVHIYANGYFKNQSIFESSLATNFPNASFAERYDVPRGDEMPRVGGRLRRFFWLG